jgi:hypothetical protein
MRKSALLIAKCRLPSETSDSFPIRQLVSNFSTGGRLHPRVITDEQAMAATVGTNKYHSSFVCLISKMSTFQLVLRFGVAHYLNGRIWQP